MRTDDFVVGVLIAALIVSWLAVELYYWRKGKKEQALEKDKEKKNNSQF